MPKDRDRSLQMLSTALEMERKGRAFYEEAVSTCRNVFGREMFQMLMKEEVIHMDRILKIHESLKAGGSWSDGWKSVKADHSGLGALFQRMASSHGTKITAVTGDLDALEVGIDLEVQAISFYQQGLEKATDALEREFLEHIIAEEKGHHAALTDMRLYLTDPAAWFGEQERSGLDGA